MSSTASKTQFSYDKFGRVTGSTQTTPNSGAAVPFHQLPILAHRQAHERHVYFRPEDLLHAGRRRSGDGRERDSVRWHAGAVRYQHRILRRWRLGHAALWQRHHRKPYLEQPLPADRHLRGQPAGLGCTDCPNGQAQCASGNTGTPYRQTIAVAGQTQAMQEFNHDSLNRLLLASEHAGSNAFTLACPDAGSVWCRQFGYDDSGNRAMIRSDPWAAATFNGKNQVADSGWAYDNAGNVIKSPGPQTNGYSGRTGRWRIART